MVRPFHAGALLLAVLTGCSPRDDEFVISDDWLIAGQRLTVFVRDACTAGGPKSTKPCATDAVKGLVRAEIGPPFTLESSEVRGGTARLVLYAQGEGESLLSATVLNEDGEEKLTSRLMTALRLDRVDMTVSSCIRSQASEPFLVPVDTRINARWELVARGRVMRGDGYFPFEASAGTFEAPDRYDVPFRTPAMLTPVTITSPADPAFRLELQTYDASSIQALRLVPVNALTSLTVGAHGSYDLAADFERTPCELGSFEVGATSETPSVCLFSTPRATPVENAATTSTVGGRLSLVGKAMGTCRFTASLAGGRLPVTVELPVAP